MIGSVHSEDTHMVRLSRLLVGVLGLFVMMMLAAPASAQTGGLRGKVTDAAGKPVEGADGAHRGRRASRGNSRSRRTRRASSSRSASTPASTRSPPRRKARSRSPTTSASASATRPWSICNWPPAPPATAQKTRSACPTCRPSFDAGVAASKAQNYDEADRVLPEGGHCRPELPRLLLQHRLCLLPEEGLCKRRSRVQEGHRAEAGLRRSVECARECLQRREEAR